MYTTLKAQLGSKKDKFVDDSLSCKKANYAALFCSIAGIFHALFVIFDCQILNRHKFPTSSHYTKMAEVGQVPAVA